MTASFGAPSLPPSASRSPSGRARPASTRHLIAWLARSPQRARATWVCVPPDTTRRVHQERRWLSILGTTPTRRRVCRLLHRLPQRPTPTHQGRTPPSGPRDANAKPVRVPLAATGAAQASAQFVQLRAQAAADLQVGQCATVRTPPANWHCQARPFVAHSASGRPSSAVTQRPGKGATDQSPSEAPPIAPSPPTLPSVRSTTTSPAAAALPLVNRQPASDQAHPTRQPNHRLGDRAVELALANQRLLALASTPGRGNRIAYRDL